ncbi:LOW QUALITY PROTEIN: three-prime repair exonuclease 1-like [Haliotis rubra]|uniref:LOW QUALITY PROTEIN: three-prime repair exonuclease 1-like n=1 Tax=Haliotis rubra TaxID=36100 RepID=UPI001EE58150|nr:LOW QUALITY PROTEIN: three-prime repair exonuclease 1-like [Haliotis rubra]
MAEGRSDADARRPIQSFVIFDTETTGLPKTGPKITELCFLGVGRKYLEGSKVAVGPRVTNQLLLCVDPRKRLEPEAASITGLDNETLADQKPFDTDMVQLMSIFLSRLPKPVCLVAHNGDWFDYPLLVSELRQVSGKLQGDLLCVDSIKAFKTLENQEAGNGQSPASNREVPQGDAGRLSSTPIPRKPSYKLEEVYRRCIGEAPPICHTAADDCLTLLKVVRDFSPGFLEWADKESKYFRNIPPMY